MSTPLLNLDDNMIERMEGDLAQKCAAAFTGTSIEAAVHGVFSLDDLEKKTESDLCGGIAIGVSYTGAEPTHLDTNPKAQLNVSGGAAMKSLDFHFVVILAVPTYSECAERYSATKLMTMLRRTIMGADIDGDRVSRKWSFVREAPDVAASTKSMLYYSQVWRVALSQVGNTS